jgi:hypothetical protein
MMAPIHQINLGHFRPTTNPKNPVKTGAAAKMRAAWAVDVNFCPTVNNRVNPTNTAKAEKATSNQHFRSFGFGNFRIRANGKRTRAAMIVRNIPTVTASIAATAISVAAGVAPQIMTATVANK